MCYKLQTLNLSACKNLVDSGLDTLLLQCGAQLKELDLSLTKMSSTQTTAVSSAKEAEIVWMLEPDRPWSSQTAFDAWSPT